MTEHEEFWYRLDILVEEDRALDALALLWELDAAGVEVQDRDTYADDESIPPTPEGANRLTAYFQRAGHGAEYEIEQEAVNLLSDADIITMSITCAPYTDRSWETAWKDYFHPTRMSPRAVVGPPWEDFEAPEGGTRLVIEPGMAFGTGTHETTQLCAEVLDGLLAESDEALSVLDVGCGSAILSMIAKRLGAGRVVGVDVDPTAVEVAQKNLVVNDLEGQIELSTTPVDQIDVRFDVVVANILTHILLHIREGLQKTVAPGGRLVLSGITNEQVDQVREAFVAPGFEEVAVRQRGDWVMFELRREM